MHTTLNDTDVVEERRGGDRYLVAQGVPIIRPQTLSNGYVPERAVANSTDQENTHGGVGWEGVTATLNHPRNLPEFAWHDPGAPHGAPILAANAEVQETLGLGELENQRFDGEFVRVDVAVNADRAEEMGGEATDVVEKMEEGEPLDVSTQYVGAELPPGEYDGEERAEVETIVAPDSLALLPNQPGQCSVEDGCGVHAPGASVATANGVTLTLNTGHAHAADDPGTTPSAGAETGEDAAGPTANETHESVWRSLGGHLRNLAADLNSLRERLGTDIVSESTVETLDTAARDANRAIDMWRAHDRANGGEGDLPGPLDPDEERATLNAERLVERAEDVVEEQAGNEGAESPADSDRGDDAAGDTMEREELIDEITENSAIKEESLEGMGDTCLQTTHENIVGNADEETGDGDDGGDDPDAGADDTEGDTDGEFDDVETDDDGNVIVADKDELASLIDERVEQRVEATANRREKAERVDAIVANSAEYGEDDRDELMDTPGAVLDRIERGLSSTVELPAAGGPQVSGNAGETTDVDEFDAGVLE